ncbi:alpha/beta fold hydrolase [Ruania zhangjianzhongii]|uniref:alpha/beta fold hydrolase n=1 Tax=Ruania zhangjianzhongii TaxID=2603206 RepID=UPI00143D4DBC|nr:alpha/beta hydrolase [Ruania zhangjianzhongii]
MTTARRLIRRGDVDISVTDRGGNGPAVVLLHGLAGSSRELLPTADRLADSFRVLLIDQRGHGDSSRHPADVSRQAFVDDVVAVLERLLPGEPAALVGQSMGAHTAFLTAASRPDLVSALVMLEGHVAGDDDPEQADQLGDYFASWPVPFAGVDHARAHLGDTPLANAWIADLETTPQGLRPRFDADVMRRTILEVHRPRWAEWEQLTVPTLAIFAEHGMFSLEEQDELIRRRPATARAALAGASHDGHLDAVEAWTRILREYLGAGASG